MNKRILHLGGLILTFLPTLCSYGQQRSDADWDAEGLVAMNQYHDCTRAKHAFEQESSVAQASPIWLDQAARASECAGNLTAALDYYGRELKKLPDTPRLVQKVGDLRYKQEVQADQARSQQAAAAEFAEQQRQQALDAQRQQQQQATQAAQLLADARANVDQEVQQLARLLETDIKVDFDYPDMGTTVHHHIKRHVTDATHCELTFTEEDNKVKGVNTVHIAFADATAEYSPTTGIGNVGVSAGGWLEITSTSGIGVFPVTDHNLDIVDLINKLNRGCSP